jgi:hypothetical protein
MWLRIDSEYFRQSLFGWLVASDWCRFVVREKYCWLTGDWWLMLI